MLREHGDADMVVEEVAGGTGTRRRRWRSAGRLRSHKQQAARMKAICDGFFFAGEGAGDGGGGGGEERGGGGGFGGGGGGVDGGEGAVGVRRAGGGGEGAGRCCWCRTAGRRRTCSAR